jgi:hypothetical protein
VLHVLLVCWGFSTDSLLLLLVMMLLVLLAGQACYQVLEHSV